MNTKTTKKKKTAVKKTAIKKVNTVKLITEKDMRCFGNFIPCPRCFDCQFSSTCFTAIIKTAKQKPAKKTIRKLNSRRLLFLVFVSILQENNKPFTHVNLVALTTRFFQFCKISGTKVSNKTFVQSFNNAVAGKNQYFAERGFKFNSNGNFLIQDLIYNNKHVYNQFK